MFRQIRPAIVLMLLMTVLTGLAYPLAITGVAQLLFPHQAGGSLVTRDGKVIVRGNTPMPPRDLIPLHMPATPTDI